MQFIVEFGCLFGNVLLLIQGNLNAYISIGFFILMEDYEFLNDISNLRKKTIAS